MEKIYINVGNRKRLAVNILCNYCGKYFLRCKVHVKRNKDKGIKNFCSKECAYKGRRDRINVFCCQCGKKFDAKPSRIKKSKSGLLFCSKECKDKGQRIENCSLSMIPSHYNNGKSSYRKKAFRLYDNKCEDCGYSKHINILEIHHIDGNRTNNDKKNLIVLCPNCHCGIHRNYAILENRKLVWGISLV